MISLLLFQFPVDQDNRSTAEQYPKQCVLRPLRNEFFVFSDGLTEGGYDGSEQLGVDGLIQLVEVYADKPLPERIRALLAALDTDGWDVRDDLTMLAMTQ